MKDDANKTKEELISELKQLRKNNNNNKEGNTIKFNHDFFYQELYDQLPIGLALTDLEGNLVDVNKAYADIIGYSIDEVHALSYWQITPKKYKPQEDEIIIILNKHGFYGPYEKEYIKKNGELVQVRLNGRIIEFDGNKYIWSSIEEISLLKKTELELKKSKKLLNDTNKISKVGGWDLNLITEELIWTDEVYRIHDLDFSYIPTLEKAINNYHPDFVKLVTDSITNTIETGNPFDFEAQIITSKKEAKWVHAKGEAIYTDKILTNIAGYFQDIDLRKKNEEYLSQLQKQLFQSQKMEAVGQIAGGMAHDFNNILNGIMGATQLILTSDDQSETNIKYLDLIINASVRASNLIKKLLLFSRKSDSIFSIIDIKKVILDTTEILDNTIDKKITIKTSFYSEDLHFYGDTSAIQNAIMNLCLNASQAIDNIGEISILVDEIQLDKKYCESSQFDLKSGDYIKIQIKDNGCGISEENLTKIYDPFFTTKKLGQGTGLGLSAIYRAILDHRGAIIVNSELTVGTTFTLLLPIIKKQTKTKIIQDEIIKGTETILFVDDEDFNRTIGEDILTILGYNVILAKDGKEAVEIYKSNYSTIDIVILDMMMPNMNGSESFKHMKSINDNCIAIISSGYNKDENINELMRLGLAGFIQKPFKISDLGQLLDNIKLPNNFKKQLS